MAKSPPKFKKATSPRTDNGSAAPFSDAKIKGAKVIPTCHPTALRAGFVKKLFTVPCGKGNLPGKNSITK
jgi:hypothetical protein